MLERGSSTAVRRTHWARTALPVVLAVVWAAPGINSRAAAEDAPGSSAAGPVQPETADLNQLWDSAKSKLKHGAYDEAKVLLDQILSLTPDDPWALTYRSLCESRLQPTKVIPRLSTEQYRKFHEEVRAEERKRKDGKGARRQQERSFQKESDDWTEAVRRLKEQAASEQRKRKHEQAKAGRKPEAAPKPAPEPVLSEEAVPVNPEAAAEPSEAEAPESAAVLPEAPAQTEGERSELSSTSEEPSAEPQAQSIPEQPDLADLAETPLPELGGGAGRPPGGGVQINARQMNMAPDRNMATAEGDVEVVFEGATLWCDRMTLFTDTGDVYAEGKVRLQQGTNFSRSELVHYNFKTRKGRFLQGTVSTPPWYEHGRSIETIAEGVYQVTPGYLTSCDLEPPHFRLFGRRAIVFGQDRAAHIRDAAFFVEKIPFFYLPYIAIADRQMPFYIIPGKKKPWGFYTLMGYHYDVPSPPGVTQKGTVKLDWRQNFGWGQGIDYQVTHPLNGHGLVKLYYNRMSNQTEQEEFLPKGADHNRYRAMFRHQWMPLANTTVITDLQEFSDINFRKELLFKDEYVLDEFPQSFISAVKNTENYSLSGLIRKRLNRFDTVTEALPQVTFDMRQQRIGDTWFFSKSYLDFANFQNKQNRSDLDQDAFRTDWYQQLSYAMNQFRPIELTPRVGVRQTYYSRDKSGDQRDFLAGQFSAGADASLKLFRLFPVDSNVLGLNLHGLRHVLTPTVGYSYLHEATTPNVLLDFPAAPGPSNTMTFGLENKLQTRRPDEKGKLRSVDLVRFLTELPYSYHGRGNEGGGRWGDWDFRLETYPWNWLRVESNWVIQSHYPVGVRDTRLPVWNVDLVMVGGQKKADAHDAPDISAPAPQGFQAGPKADTSFIPLGQWYLGLGHRYSSNDKTEDVLQYDFRLTDKWQVTTFHRYTWKEVVAGNKRFYNLREFQYGLKRDLHDWVAELVYRVDREYGEEIFLTFTLKAFPDMPLETQTSYHQPKFGSQSSPFSPVQ